MASAEATMGGPQQSVLEETISETETVMPTINPMNGSRY